MTDDSCYQKGIGPRTAGLPQSWASPRWRPSSPSKARSVKADLSIILPNTYEGSALGWRGDVRPRQQMGATLQELRTWLGRGQHLVGRVQAVEWRPQQSPPPSVQGLLPPFQPLQPPAFGGSGML